MLQQASAKFEDTENADSKAVAIFVDWTGGIGSVRAASRAYHYVIVIDHHKFPGAEVFKMYETSDLPDNVIVIYDDSRAGGWFHFPLIS